MVGRDVETTPQADRFTALTQGIEKCQQAGATVKALDKRADSPADKAACARASDIIIKCSKAWPVLLKSTTPGTKAKR